MMIVGLMVVIAVMYFSPLWLVGWASLALYPEGFNPVQLLTYWMLHVNFGHLLLNLLGLGIMGMLFGEPRSKFMTTFFAGVVGGGLAHCMFYSDPLIGASGGLFALLALAIPRFPYWHFRVVCGFLIAVEVYLGGAAHLGGLVAGTIVYQSWKRYGDSTSTR